MAQASSREMPRSLGARAAAERRVPPQSGQTSLFQKLLHPLHALFVLDLGKGIFHGVDGVEIGEVQFASLIRMFLL